MLLDNSLKQMHLAALARDKFVDREIKELHGRVNQRLLKPAEGRVRQDVTCPIRYSIIYALIWVERSHVTRVSPLWQNRDVILL